MMAWSNGNISALLALSDGNAAITVGFSSQSPVMLSFDVFAPKQTFQQTTETQGILDTTALIMT